MTRTREEQIDDLANCFGEEGTFTFVDDRDAATKHITEAEQRGYERARAECAEDTKRLEWLSKQFKSSTVYMNGDAIFSANHKVFRMRARTFRSAIDAAMKEDGQ